MAQSQLPPKVPTMIQNWASSPFQLIPMTATTSAAVASHQNSWVDEFLEFSSARRNAHRRSISDPVAFVETTTPCNNKENGGFDRLDDEQLRKMFSDDVLVAEMGGQGMSSSGPSTPSDEISGNRDKMLSPHPDGKVMLKSEPEDLVVDSSFKTVMDTHAAGAETEAEATNPPAANNGSTDSFVDPKRIKRIMANRQSAQRSRVRKLQYVSELERSVTTLQTEVSTLSPRVAYLDHQRLILNVDNTVLKQRIAALAQDQIFKNAHQEALRKEIERLREIYHEQSMKKVSTNTNINANNDTNEVCEPQKGPTSNFTKNLMGQEN